MKKLGCLLLAVVMLLGCMPNPTTTVYAKNNGIKISNITKTTAEIDWSRWAKDHDYLSYFYSTMSEEELGGKDPYNVKSYFDGIYTNQTFFLQDYLEKNTKYYVCVLGRYDFEGEDYSEGKPEPQAIFTEFTTKGDAVKVSLNQKTANLTVGAKTEVYLYGVDISKQTFKSSNSKIAKVSKTGVVTALKKGSCKITVTDKKTKKKYTCKITVKSKNDTKDFLSKNGLKVTPTGSTTVKLAVGAGETLTNKVEKVKIDTSIDTHEAGTGYVADTFAVFLPLKKTGNTYFISAFDRYTGTSFETCAENLDNGPVNSSRVTLDVNGKKYNCTLSTTVTYGEKQDIIVLSVTHPVEYDGLVFSFGQHTKKQMAAYNKINFEEPCTITDYSDVFVEGQTFFTVSGK